MSDKEFDDVESFTLTCVSYSRIKIGKCIIRGCFDNELLDCIKCHRHDLCHKHMGGQGFTRVYCPQCLKKLMENKNENK